MFPEYSHLRQNYWRLPGKRETESCISGRQNHEWITLGRKKYGNTYLSKHWSPSHLKWSLRCDTELSALPCYHADPQSHSIYFWPDRKTKLKTKNRWNIWWLLNSLGVFLSRLLLRFAHAMAGCDTTSRLFGGWQGWAFEDDQTWHTLPRTGCSFQP